jgi:hypothetical protein
LIRTKAATGSVEADTAQKVRKVTIKRTGMAHKRRLTTNLAM